jgi:hyperosmotically inducible periplasmic protein
MVHEPPITSGGLPEHTDMQKTKDALLETRVAGALATTPGIESLDIAVAAQSGTIHLSGSVPDQRQMDKARDVAQNIDGVERVVSRLAVGHMGH